MIMALLYAPDDFSRAQTIVCTSGWDTDCNAGNVGCLMGAMLGLEGIDIGGIWRGPLADRMLISSADGGNAINDAVRVSARLVDLGRGWRICLRSLRPRTEHNSIFHCQGSVQGFARRGQRLGGIQARERSPSRRVMRSSCASPGLGSSPPSR